jgi:hypothetical protein
VLHSAAGRHLGEARTHLLCGEFLGGAGRRASPHRPDGAESRTDHAGRPDPTAASNRAACCYGRVHKQVAAQLFLGARTVDTHLRFAKLGICSRAELVRFRNLAHTTVTPSAAGLEPHRRSSDVVVAVLLTVSI